jgi:hypothetical protein
MEEFPFGTGAFVNVHFIVVWTHGHLAAVGVEGVRRDGHQYELVDFL